MTKDNRMPIVEGSADPMQPGCLLVPIDRPHRTFPKVARNVPPTTFYRWSRRARALVAMVTVTPNGLYLGWDTCGMCLMHITKCSCASGISASDATRHIYQQDGGELPALEVIRREPLSPREALGLRPHVPSPTTGPTLLRRKLKGAAGATSRTQPSSTSSVIRKKKKPTTLLRRKGA